MAHFTFDERETDQLYVAAKELGNQFLKAKKLAMTLHLSAPALAEIDDQIHRNTELRTVLNPRAEEEARAAARKRRGDRSDPRQLDLEHEIKVAAEPNGDGKKARKARKISTSPVVDGLEVANPEATQEPDDEYLLVQLRRAGIDTALGVVEVFTSSERDQALGWTIEALRNPESVSPEMPAHLWKAVWAGQYDFDPLDGTPALESPATENSWRWYWADVGPFTVVESRASKRGGASRYEVRNGQHRRVKTFRSPLEAEQFAGAKNREAAVSTLLTGVRERRTAGDGWTAARPPKVDDVGAERVHKAAKEAR